MLFWLRHSHGKTLLSVLSSMFTLMLLVNVDDATAATDVDVHNVNEDVAEDTNSLPSSDI